MSCPTAAGARCAVSRNGEPGAPRETVCQYRGRKILERRYTHDVLHGSEWHSRCHPDARPGVPRVCRATCTRTSLRPVGALESTVPRRRTFDWCRRETLLE